MHLFLFCNEKKVTILISGQKILDDEIYTFTYSDFIKCGQDITYYINNVAHTNGNILKYECVILFGNCKSFK